MKIKKVVALILCGAIFSLVPISSLAQEKQPDYNQIVKSSLESQTQKTNQNSEDKKQVKTEVLATNDEIKAENFAGQQIFKMEFSNVLQGELENKVREQLEAKNGRQANNFDFQAISELIFRENTQLNQADGDFIRSLSGIRKIDLSGHSVNFVDQIFSDNVSLTEVVLPGGANISNKMFFGCLKLKTIINIESAGVNFGEAAFEGCKSIESINLPNNAFIADRLFADCSSLKFIDLTRANVNLGKSAFSGTSQMKYAYLPNGAIISERLFDSSGLIKIELENANITFGDFAFYKCQKLVSVRLPNNAKISNFMFAYCSSLPSINLTNVDGDFGESAFAYCKIINDVKLPQFSRVSANMFLGCTYLDKVEWNEPLGIKPNAFDSCSFDLTRPDSYPNVVANSISTAFKNQFPKVYLSIPSEVIFIRPIHIRNNQPIFYFDLPTFNYKTKSGMDYQKLYNNRASYSWLAPNIKMPKANMIPNQWIFKEEPTDSKYTAIGEGMFTVYFKIDDDIPASPNSMDLYFFVGGGRGTWEEDPENKNNLQQQVYSVLQQENSENTQQQNQLVSQKNGNTADKRDFYISFSIMGVAFLISVFVLWIQKKFVK